MLAPDGNAFNCIQLKNDFLQIEVMDWGATWISCKIKRENGWQEVLLGCDLEDYPAQKAYLGASIGRYANRIAQSQFYLNETTFQLNSNQGKHQLHGGKGFDQKRWNIKSQGKDFITFSHFSPHNDEGFPGNCTIECTYRLSYNLVRIEYTALCDKDCPINLTNHAYFNLQEAKKGCDVRYHYLQINSDHFLPVDNEGIPNQPLKNVTNTAFDFRRTKSISQNFGEEEQLLTQGYDHSFLLNPNVPFAAKLSCANGLSLTLQTSQTAIQVYTGNFLKGTPTRGKKQYENYYGIALETQALPDTPNHPEWWQYGGITKANKPYHHWTNFIFEET